MRLEKASYPSYPAINLLRRHGKMIAIGIALLPMLGAALGFANGFGAWILALGVIGSAITFLLMRVLIELVSIVADLLLPR